MEMPDFQRFPSNQNLIINVVLLTRKVFLFWWNFHCFIWASHICSDTSNEKKNWTWISILCLIRSSNKAVKGTVVNQTLSSLHKGSLEITLTASLRIHIFSAPFFFVLTFYKIQIKNLSRTLLSTFERRFPASYFLDWFSFLHLAYVLISFYI